MVGTVRKEWSSRSADVVAREPSRSGAAGADRPSIPDVTVSFVLRHAERLADAPALIDGASGRTLTYGELAGAVDRVAGGLAARGVRRAAT